MISKLTQLVAQDVIIVAGFYETMTKPLPEAATHAAISSCAALGSLSHSPAYKLAFGILCLGAGALLLAHDPHNPLNRDFSLGVIGGGIVNTGFGCSLSLDSSPRPRHFNVDRPD